MSSVYLDYNATTPMDPVVAQAMQPFLGQWYGNPSSVHRAGRYVADAVAKARTNVARAFGGFPSDVLFTSSGTEALNVAIWSALENSEFDQPHIVVSAVEHKAVLELCYWLDRNGKATLTEVQVDEFGRIDVNDVVAAVRNETALVATMRLNNELGNIYDTQAISAAVKAKNSRTVFLVDTVQAAGKLPVSIDSVAADFIAVSAHKIYGPKGVGALIRKRNGPAITKFLYGGVQEHGLRAGTENVPGIVGFGAACQLPHATQHIAEMGERLRHGIHQRIGGIRELGDMESHDPGTLSLHIESVDAEAVLIELDLRGVSASSGSACTSGADKPSHVLTAIGLSSEMAWQTVRLSLGRFTTAMDIDFAVTELESAVRKCRS